MTRRAPLPRPTARAVVLAAAATLPLTACAGSMDADDATAGSGDEQIGSSSAGSADDAAGASMASASVGSADSDDSLGAVGTLSSAEVHAIDLEFDTAEYDAMIAAYAESGDKEWIEATVTIDGVTYEQVGLRLKGNSSLRGIAGGGFGGRGGDLGAGLPGDASAEDPETLPWLIRLDKYVDGQSHDGLADLVVRSNNSATSLNEAVALELLELAGLASQDAIATAFSVNGSDPVLRLVIEHPDDVWMAEWLDDDGALYKAESTGDYSYRGDDPDAYDEVFDQEAGKDDTDLTPLVDFLQFLNESDDATFAAELADRFDVESFATYLAMQELVNNFDDIDGPGNNSYLHYDTGTGMFTVVAWDHNLAFGQGPGGGRFPGGGELPDIGAGGFPVPGDGELPEIPDDAELPEFGRPPGGDVGGDVGGRGGFGGGGPGGSNILVERFLEVDEWQALYEQRLAELRAELYESGVAAEVLAEWTDVIESSGLVDAATVESEASNIASQLS